MRGYSYDGRALRGNVFDRSSCGLVLLGGLKDKGQFARFFAVSILGTVADYLLAVTAFSVFSVPSLVASTLGFILGAMVNYVGHNLYSYEHESRASISFVGFGKYLAAVLISLGVRLSVVGFLEFVSALPFWFVLIVAIGASFISSYVISTLWVFKRSS